METTLYGKKVQIPDNFLTEVSIYESFVKYADEAKKAYYTYYHNASGINQVISGSRSVIYAQYKNIANKVISLLATNGIYGYSENDILQLHSFYEVDEALEKMANNASDIDVQRNNEKAYRNYRKKSRGRFIGGGFGLEGAIKGMAMASAANAATGMLHSVVNVFGNIGSSIKRGMALESLYHSGICLDIVKAIDKDAMAFYDVLEQIFYDNGIKRGNIPERIKEADAIYRQLENGTIPASSQKDAVISMITTFPGKFEYYALAVNLLGGSNGELKNLVQEFGLDTEYFMVIEASAEWRNLIFGDFKTKISKENQLNYLTRLLYSKWGYGVISQLEYGPVRVISALVAEFIQEFRAEANIGDLEFYTFEEGNNGFLLSLFESRNLKLSINEVPIFCVNIATQITKNAKAAEYLLLTSDKIYFISKDGKVSKASIQNIDEIVFYDDYNLGTQINGSWFAPKVNFSNTCDYEFLCLLKSIIALIQCLQSVGHTNRSAAIIDKNSLLDDYDSANDISVYFRAPIDGLMKEYGSIHNIVLETIDGAYQCASDSARQEIEILRGELNEAHSEEEKYEIKKQINDLNIVIQSFGTDKNLELIEKNEIIVGLHSSSDLKLILTDKKLYLYFPPKSRKENIRMNLSEIKSAYYEWSFASEAFWINGLEYPTTSGNKNDGKTFIGLLYWLTRYQKEWDMFLSNENNSSNQNDTNENKITLEQATRDFKEIFSSYKSMLLGGKVASLWDIAESGDAIAEFVLEQFYKEEVLCYAIKKCDLTELKIVLKIIASYATEGHPFGLFLSQYLTKNMYLANNTDRAYWLEIRKCNEIIEQLEECISLCADKGFEIVESNVIDKDDGLLMLKRAAENYHPMAMAWYGSYLYNGLHRVRKDEALGRFYIELAAYAGQGYALKLNEEYGFGFEQYQEHLIQDDKAFEMRNDKLHIKTFPRYLTEKYISGFTAHNKDVIFDKNGLQSSQQLTETKNSLQIPSDEIVFLAVSASFLGHFKKNMTGLAIGSKGVYINGGKLGGGAAFVNLEALQEKSIFVKDGLHIDGMSISLPSMNEMLKDLLIDLREISNIDIDTHYPIQDIDIASENTVAEEDKKSNEETLTDIVQEAEIYKPSYTTEDFYKICFSFDDSDSTELSTQLDLINQLKNGNIFYDAELCFSIINISDENWERITNFQNKCDDFAKDEVLIWLYDNSDNQDGSEGVLITNKNLYWIYNEKLSSKLQMMGFDIMGKADLNSIEGNLDKIPLLLSIPDERKEECSNLIMQVVNLANKCVL